MSSDRPRQKVVRFVDVTSQRGSDPDWMGSAPANANVDDGHIETLRPPKIPREPRHPLAPILESVLPPPPSQPPGMHAPFASDVESLPLPPLPPLRPSQFPRRPSQFPPDPAYERRTDTLIEELIPRAEEEASAAILQAVDAFALERRRLLDGAEAELLTLVRSVARRVIARELSNDPALVEGLVRVGLEALGQADRVTVRLGPFFADAVYDLKEKLEQRGVNCLVLVDSSLGAYGCLLETELGKVDESVEARLDVLMTHLMELE